MSKMLKLSQRIFDKLGYLFTIAGLDTKLVNAQQGHNPYPQSSTEKKLLASLMDKNIQANLWLFRVKK